MHDVVDTGFEMHSSRSSSGCSRLPVVVKVFQSLNPLPDHESQGLQQQFQQAYSDTQQVLFCLVVCLVAGEAHRIYSRRPSGDCGSKSELVMRGSCQNAHFGQLCGMIIWRCGCILTRITGVGDDQDWQISFTTWTK